MLKFTGHPFYDIGVAVCCAFAGKRDPMVLTPHDLDAVAAYIEDNYPRQPLKNFYNVAFTKNAWFNHIAYDKDPAKRHDLAQRLLHSFGAPGQAGAETCVFTGAPATAMAFSDALPPGRAFRQHIPMLTGEGCINFYPYGEAGLPVSGEAILALQAFPLGCANCGGRLLAVHSDNPDIIREFAGEFLQQNRQRILLAQQAGSTKMPGADKTARTLLIDTFLQISEQLREERAASVTAYHFTNSGQSNPLDENNPPLAIYHLPFQLTDFLRQVHNNPRYKQQWRDIVHRAWRLENANGGGRGRAAVERPAHNFLYEDLFRLPDMARPFIRRYFLRIPAVKGPADDPRRTYSPRQEGQLISWAITDLFLRKVMNVEQDRIDQIRDFADRLAAYVSEENDKRFFTAFYSERNYEYLRSSILKANLRRIRAGGPPLVTLDSYLDVFEEGVDELRPDWRLARDLVLIRLIERLYEAGWFRANQDALPDETEATPAAAEEV